MTAYLHSSADVIDETALAECSIESHGERHLAPGKRHIVLEFDSFEEDQACYHSPEHQKALAIAKKAVVRDAVILEGGGVVSRRNRPRCS